MSLYKPRKIEFREVFNIDDWLIKIYTISKSDKFDHPEFYRAVKKEIRNWLVQSNSFNPNNDKIGFLILHSGNEGIFSIINWWVDKHMMNSHIFLTTLDKQTHFSKISGDGLAPCIWELEVINHERISWTDNILKKAPYPNYTKYLEDIINKEL